MKIVAIVLVVIAVLGVGCASSIIGYRNTWVAQERGLQAQQSQNKNSYDSMVKKVRETAQVPEMYAEDFEKVYRATMEGRYGENGSRAMMQWITEQNPQLDSTLYRQVQQVIEAGRNDFATNQKLLVDKRREYEISIDQFPGNIVAGLMGFPRIDLTQFDVVTSGETETAFETKKADPIQLRPGKKE